MSDSLETTFFLIKNKIEEKKYEEAVSLVDQELQKNNESFNAWVFWLLGGLSFAYQNNNSSFHYYISKAEELNSNYFGFHYLSAYNFLLEDNIEQALIEWLKILDITDASKKLAKDLIEKTRLNYPLVIEAQEGNFEKFFSLDFLDIIFFNKKNKSKNNIYELEESFHKEDKKAQKEIASLYKTKRRKENKFLKKLKSNSYSKSQSINKTEKEKQIKNKKIRLQSLQQILFKNYRKLTIILILFLFVFSISFVLFYNYFKNKKEAPIWEKFRIDSYANVLPIQKSKKKFYKKKYKNRKDLIQDFNFAKLFLYKKQFNKARYLLQKIIYSNADFKSKEKAKIFLNFIPDSEQDSFNDNLKVSQIISKPVLRKNSFILWEGKILKLKNTNKGQIIRLLVREEEKDYIIEGYILNKNTENSVISSIENKKKLEELYKLRKKAVIFGQFKGLIGKQKTIYIEIKKIWI